MSKGKIKGLVHFLGQPFFPFINIKGMPRKIGTAVESEFDIRITPSDQQPIFPDEFRSHLKDAIQVIACEEGEPNGKPQLHYHLYVKAKISASTIDKICAKLGRATADKKGNAVFSSRPAHENTIGYVVKQRKVVYATEDQNVLETYFELSKDYRKAKEAARKDASRSSEKSLDIIMNGIEVDSHSLPIQVVCQILEAYTQLGKKFPPKSQIESAVLKKLYPVQRDFVINNYAKNLQMSHDQHTGNYR